MNPLLELKSLGQHIWLDNLSRTLLRSGELKRLIAEDGVDGVTSNPAIFQKAIAGSPYYADDLAGLRAARIGVEACYEALVVPDVQAACDILNPSYVASNGETGYVSLEVSPALAQDQAGTEAAALRLRKAVGRDNLLIKVPATTAGIAAFENLTASGVRVNVTLIFSLAQYQAVVRAYVRGARHWFLSGGNPGHLRSVASVFLSRVDTLVDQRLETLATPAALALRGRAGIALAKACYGVYREIFHGILFSPMAMAGVKAQAPLWASTGSKNPAYSDVLYVEKLIGAETINTLPDTTLAAFRDHGRAGLTLESDMEGASAHLAALADLGINPTGIGETLQRDGVALFAAAYGKILSGIELAPAGGQVPEHEKSLA